MASLSSAPMQSFCLFTEETDYLVHTPLLGSYALTGACTGSF